MAPEDDKPDLVGPKNGPKNNAEEHEDNNDVEELENFLETALEEELEQQQEDEQEPQQEELRLEDLPKRADGTIDVASLTPEQHKVYTAAVMSILTDDQLARYESFRRSKLTEPLRRLVQIVTGTKPDVHNRLLIALSSVTKSFVGELIEEARRIADEEGHGGPLQPQHVHVAYAKLKAENRVECAAPVKNRFRL